MLPNRLNQFALEKFMKYKMSIHRMFFFYIIAIALLSVFFFGFWQINILYRDFNTNKRVLQQEYEAEQKEIIKSEVQKMAFYIRNLIYRYETSIDYDIEVAKQEILETLVKQRFGENGYFFGSTFQGDPLFSNGVITIGKGSVWNLTDRNGVKIIQEQIKMASNPEGGYVSYLWNKSGETESSYKISYVAGVSEWQWVIGAGVYLDEIENLIATKKVELQRHVRYSIMMLGIATIIFLLFFYVIAKIISKRIKRNFDLFFNFFQNKDDCTARIEKDKLDFPEFKTLAHAVNIMMERRERSEKALQISEAELTRKNEELEKEINNRINAEKSLRESEKTFRSIVESSPLGIYIYRLEEDDRLVFESGNSAAERLTGARNEERIGMTIEEAFPALADTEVPEKYRLAAKKGENWSTNQINYKDNVIHGVFEVSVFQMQPGKVAVLFNNITDRLKVEEELKAYRDNLEEMIEERTKSLLEKTSSYEDSQLALSFLVEDVNEARIELEKANSEMAALNKELESFSYSISHDLRAPLRAIDGFSKILEEEYSTSLDEEGEEYIKIIRDNTQMMGYLISDLLEFSHLSRKNLSKFSLDLNSIVLEECNKIKGEYPDLDIDFRISELLPLKGDRAMIKQVYANLVSNAVKYSSTRKKPIIEIGCKQDEDKIIYFVKDNGVGFDMKYSHKLFGVFQRLHAVEEFEGTGVGLAIVQRIVVKHGGKVWAESELDKGATFYFSIPI